MSLCYCWQVTTHSKLVTERERQDLERQLPGFTFKLLSLQAFHTEQQFRHQLRYCTFHSKFLLDAIVKAAGSHTGNKLWWLASLQRCSTGNCSGIIFSGQWTRFVWYIIQCSMLHVGVCMCVSTLVAQICAIVGYFSQYVCSTVQYLCFCTLWSCSWCKKCTKSKFWLDLFVLGCTTLRRTLGVNTRWCWYSVSLEGRTKACCSVRSTAFRAPGRTANTDRMSSSLFSCPEHPTQSSLDSW
jgi:hypothetical protein